MRFEFDNYQVTVNVPTRAKLKSLITQRFISKTGFGLATINLDHLVKLSQPCPFRDAYSVQDFVVADGNPIVWLSRVARTPVELLPGSELIHPICQWAAEHGVTVGLIGSTEDTLNKAAQALTNDIDGLKITYISAPVFGFDPNGKQAKIIIRELETAKIGVCFLALGAPKQEQLAALGRQLAPSVGFVSIGAGLDFIAGHQTRAPKWVRAIALEWLWRALTNPMRLIPRYWKCIRILPVLYLQSRNNRN